MATLSEHYQIEGPPIEGLPEMVKAILEISDLLDRQKRLFDVATVAGHVRKIDSTAHCKQHAKQLLEEAVLPRTNARVMEGRHFCEDVFKRRRY